MIFIIDIIKHLFKYIFFTIIIIIMYMSLNPSCLEIRVYVL